MNGIVPYVASRGWLLSRGITFWGFIHVVACVRASFLLWLSDGAPSVCTPCCYAIICPRTFGSLPPCGCREWSCPEHSQTRICLSCLEVLCVCSRERTCWVTQWLCASPSEGAPRLWLLHIHQTAMLSSPGASACPPLAVRSSSFCTRQTFPTLPRGTCSETAVPCGQTWVPVLWAVRCPTLELS